MKNAQTVATVSRVSPKEARGILQRLGYELTTKTIREWCRDRKLIGAHKLQGRWHIPECDLNDLLNGER